MVGLRIARPGKIDSEWRIFSAEDACRHPTACRDLSPAKDVTMRRFPILLTIFTAIACFAPITLTLADDKPEIKSFDSDGVKIVYFTQGKGEPVVLIHGWISSAGINWSLPGTSA